MNFKHILAIDPSGSFDEGQGITGWCLMDCTKNNKIVDSGIVDSGKYICPQAYWNAHLELLDTYIDKYGRNLIIVIEDFVLYADKSASQINSKMETCRLLGVLQHYCWVRQACFSMQLASAVVNRWNNTVLEHKRIIYKNGKSFSLPGNDFKLSRHTLDSIRHATHYATFRNRR